MTFSRWLLAVVFIFSFISGILNAEQSNKPESASPTTINSSLSKIIDNLFKKYLFNDDEIKNRSLNLEQTIDGSIREEELLKIESPGAREIKIDTPQIGIGANLRILDKIYGTIDDFKILNKQNIIYNSITIKVEECVYSDKITRSESLSLIKFFNHKIDKQPYFGWISSSLSHLTEFDHYRYNVWLLSCINSDQELLSGSSQKFLSLPIAEAKSSL